MWRKFRQATFKLVFFGFILFFFKSYLGFCCLHEDNICISAFKYQRRSFFAILLRSSSKHEK